MALWFESALLETGWASGVRVTLDGARIAMVEAGVESAPEDSRHGAAIPGLANLHSHAFQRAIAGLTEVRGPASDNFWTWREQMYRFLDRIDPDAMRTITALAHVEMLETGFTRVGEFHYVHNDPDGRSYAEPGAMAAAVGEAAAETGLALTLLPVFYAHSDFGGAAPTHGQRRFVTSLDGFARIVEACRGVAGANVGVAPHSLRAVTPEQLGEVAALGDGPIHIHAAEQTGEVEACLRWSGARPVEWLLDNASVDARWCLVHATHLTDAETDRLASSGAVAGLCPVTEANLGDGIFPTRVYLDRGGAFGIGTDSNVAIDAAQELRTLEYAQRLFTRSRNVLADEGASTGGTLFRKALAGGHQALGVEAGRIAAGAPADIVSFARGFPVLGRGDAVLDSWIFAGARDHVDSVWRSGKQVVRGGRHIDRDAVAARYSALMRSLLA
jgi:formimidoylglutamate deiminase